MPVPSLSFPFRNDCLSYQITLDPGVYVFEAWGASGGNSEYGGKGAFVKAKIHLLQSTNYYIFVGGKGGDPSQEKNLKNGGCNGGGDGGDGYKKENGDDFFSGGGGGGATDIRTSESIESRILVAAGGGGCSGLNKENTAKMGGYGGDEVGGIGEGFSETIDLRLAANQTFGNGLFQGENGRTANSNYRSGGEGSGGGGGGFYGGLSPDIQGPNTTLAGGGGSSYINKTLFVSYKLYSGAKGFMSPSGEYEESGHSGDGFFRIQPIDTSTCQMNSFADSQSFIPYFFIYLIYNS